MILASGVAKVEVPPTFSYGGNSNGEADLLVSINHLSSLQLVSKDKRLSETLRKICRDDTIAFEGMLFSDEPGLVYVKLESVKIVSSKRKKKEVV